MTLNIILVNEARQVQENVEFLLSDPGYAIVHSFGRARDALAALDGIAAGADLVLVDFDLDNAVELVAEIRSRPEGRDIPVLAMIGPDAGETVSTAMMAGVNDYVRKPLERAELRARVASQLRLRSEIERRRFLKRALAREGRRPVPVAAHATGLLLDRDALVGMLREMPGGTLAALGLIAVRPCARLVASLDLTGEERDALGRALAREVAREPLPAGDLVVRWDDLTLVCASQVQDAAALQRSAAALSRALADGLQELRDLGGMPGAALWACAAPGSFATAAAGFGDLIRALDAAETAPVLPVAAELVAA